MKLPAVLCCRCSPAQKAQIVEGIKKYNVSEKNRVAAIGDGGNDVGMIQAADIGLGIAGKEGKQAALAADYSMEKFKHVKKLLLWHGRLSYKRSALLAQFVIHRGLIISVMQFIFSCIFYFVSIPVFNSVLQLGYATIFTFWPVFSLIFDEDVNVTDMFDLEENSVGLSPTLRFVTARQRAHSSHLLELGLEGFLSGFGYPHIVHTPVPQFLHSARNYLLLSAHSY
jgi:phospholipid-translocating ATPase